MPLLLDTHAFLWWLGDSRNLPAAWRRAISEPSAQVFVSAASLWEIAVKRDLGKLRLALPASLTLETLPPACGFTDLAIEGKHAAAVAGLPRHHADPFDRILIAQARVEGLTLVTADRVMDRYDVERLGP
jgi:PIN domain nuclease of toxin-antitoxin system